MKTFLRRMALRSGYQIQKIRAKSVLFDPARSTICRFAADGQEMAWFVENPEDHIQSRHAEGRFFEQEELDLIRAHYDTGGVFVDIGTNVGNHAIFVGKILGGAGVIAFEPGLKQHTLCCVNIALNEQQDRIRLHRCGLSDAPALLAISHGGGVNLGRARIVDDFSGEIIRLEVGDDILAGEKVSFIKIDVEGHELSVLRGLDQTIRANRPKILVEVEAGNQTAFAEWRAAIGYSEVVKVDHDAHLNVLIAPA